MDVSKKDRKNFINARKAMMKKFPVNEVTCTNDAMRFRLPLLLYTRPLTESQLT